MPDLRYFPPNIVTGFRVSLTMFAVAAIFNGNVQQGAYWILATIVIDMIDGFIAIALDAKSRFGNELDTQADVVNFGVATALLLYSYEFQALGTFGIILGAMPLVVTILRASVYAVQEQDGIMFRGLVTPGSALILLGLVFWDFNLLTQIIILLLTCGLMVSPFKYFRIRGIIAVGAAILFIVSAIWLPKGLMILGLVYGLHGPIYSLTRVRQ